MISVEEAKERIREHVRGLCEGTEEQVENALNRVLGEDVFCPLDLPGFDQSNVDGYALYSVENTSSWEVVGEIKAGDNPHMTLQKGQAVRIFTGAKVPEQAAAIVMQEHVLREQNTIHLKADVTIHVGDHIRKKGRQIKQGELALEKGIVISAATISFLSMMGLTKINVSKKPRVSLVITGNEIQDPGTILQEGKVYESTLFALRSMLEKEQNELVKFSKVRDARDEVRQAVQHALEDADVLILTGGISVGDYDYVHEVLTSLGVEQIFYKVAQKPGKPLYVGKKDQRLVFALPGNPASSLTCCYEYVLPALRLLSGQKEGEMKRIFLPLSRELSKTPNLAFFLKARIKDGFVEVLEGQESFIMKSFSEADSFVYIPKEKTEIKKGELVEVHLFS